MNYVDFHSNILDFIEFKESHYKDIPFAQTDFISDLYDDFMKIQKVKTNRTKVEGSIPFEIEQFAKFYFEGHTKHNDWVYLKKYKFEIGDPVLHITKELPMCIAARCFLQTKGSTDEMYLASWDFNGIHQKNLIHANELEFDYKIKIYNAETSNLSIICYGDLYGKRLFKITWKKNKYISWRKQGRKYVPIGLPSDNVEQAVKNCNRSIERFVEKDNSRYVKLDSMAVHNDTGIYSGFTTGVHYLVRDSGNMIGGSKIICLRNNYGVLQYVQSIYFKGV